MKTGRGSKKADIIFLTLKLVVTPVAAVVAPATVTAAVPKSPPKQSIDLFADESPSKSAAPSMQPSNGVSSGTSGSVNDIKVVISDPRKAGDGIGAFMVFTVKTETSRAGWGGKVFEVNRRFSDFLGLYEKLAGRYQHKGYFIFPAPEKSISSFTKGFFRLSLFSESKSFSI